MTPTPKAINDVLSRIERDSKHPRLIARELIHAHRIPPRLTQEQIDGGYDHEERRRRFVASAVRFNRRSIFSRLIFWR